MSTLKVGDIKHESFTGTTQLKLDSAGNVGIGTTSPSGASGKVLEINGGSGQARIVLKNSTTGSASTDGHQIFSDGTTLGIQNREAGSTTFETNGSERMRIDSSGKLAIGTTTPYTYGIATFNDSNGIVLEGSSQGRLLFRDTGGGTNLKMFDLASSDGVLKFRTIADNGTTVTERMRIDSSGFVGIGESSPVSYDQGARTLVISQGGTLAGMTIRASQQGSIYFADGTSSTESYRGRIEYVHADDALKFGTAAAETMRLGRNGSHAQVFMNCTESFSNAMFSLQTNGTTGIGIKTGATNQQFCINFRNPNGEVGTINTSGSGTSYNTSSDYRLKENAVAISDGISRLKTLIPYRFNFKADATTTVDGFFAHEVTAVPEAITGTKDEVDSDNNPVYQGIDQSKLVPLLTAALQEAIGRIEALEAG
jgi:hypothetical protein